MHPAILNSGLADKFKISDSGQNELSGYIGKIVRYKAELRADRKFVEGHGTIILQDVFHIQQTQKVWDGSLALRGYAMNPDTLERWDSFGRPIREKHIEIIGEIDKSGEIIIN